MARDVEANLTANDRTGSALLAAERNFKRTADRIKRDNDKLGRDMGQSLEKEFTRSTAKLSSSLLSAFESVGTSVGPLLAVGAVAAAPLIANTLAAAVIGGAGVGGMVGGLLVASKDTRVRAAFDDVAKRLQTRLETAAGSFVQPAIDGVHTISKAIDSIDLESIFRQSSRFVAPLAASVASAIADLGDGLEDLVRNAGPVINAISVGVEGLGEAIGKGLSSLSDNADEAALSLHEVFNAVQLLTSVTFGLVNALVEINQQMRTLGLEFDAGLSVISKVLDALNPKQVVGTWVDPAADAAERLRTQLLATVEPGNQLAAVYAEVAQASRDLAAAHHSLFDATTSVFEAMDKMKQAVKENGKTLDVHTEKGRANRTALSNLATALNADYDAYVKVNGAGDGANRVAGQNYSAFIKAATGAGISKRAARDYALQLGLIPPKKKTDMVANTHDAAARIAALQAQINRLHGKTVTIRTVITGGRLAGSVHVSGPGGSGTQVKGAATAMWSAAAGGGGYRTGGPAGLFADVQNTVYLDGRLFDRRIERVAMDERQRADYRRRVGPRR